MPDLKDYLLLNGGLLLGDALLLITYLILRRKAQRDSAGRWIFEIEWWQHVCRVLFSGLHVGAIIWISAITAMFANLIDSWDETCPSIITQDACSRAAFNWQTSCTGIVEFACAVLFVIVFVTYAEAKSPDTTPEHVFAIAILTWSHAMFLLSWFLCMPLAFPRLLFRLTGTRYWVAMSSNSAVVAITAFIVGVTLWIIACIRFSYALRHQARERASEGAHWPGTSDRDVPLQDV